MDRYEYMAHARQSPLAGSELSFSAEEMDERVARVQESMAEHRLDGLILCDPGNLYYLTGYYTFETSVHGAALVTGRGLALQVHAIEISNPILKGKVTEIESYSPQEGPDAISKQLVEMIRARGIAAGRIGIETLLPGMRVKLFRDLEAALPDAKFVDATDLVMRIRAVKSARELEYHRKAADITSAGMLAAYAALGEGKTENDIAAVGAQTMIEAGSEFFTIQPVVVAGSRTSFNHAHYHRTPLRKGDPVLLEFGGCYARYTSPIIRSASIGTPTDEMRRLDAHVCEAVEAVIATARAGVTAHEVALAASKAVAPLQAESYHYGTYAYAVGAQFPPSWVERSIFIAEGQHQPLEAGMVFHMPICFRLPGRFGIGCSETIAITETGCDVLTSVPRGLHVVHG